MYIFTNIFKILKIYIYVQDIIGDGVGADNVIPVPAPIIFGDEIFSHPHLGSPNPDKLPFLLLIITDLKFLVFLAKEGINNKCRCFFVHVYS